MIILFLLGSDFSPELGSYDEFDLCLLQIHFSLQLGIGFVGKLFFAQNYELMFKC